MVENGENEEERQAARPGSWIVWEERVGRFLVKFTTIHSSPFPCVPPPLIRVKGRHPS